MLKVLMSKTRYSSPESTSWRKWPVSLGYQNTGVVVPVQELRGSLGHVTSTTGITRHARWYIVYIETPSLVMWKIQKIESLFQLTSINETSHYTFSSLIRHHLIPSLSYNQHWHWFTCMYGHISYIYGIMHIDTTNVRKLYQWRLLLFGHLDGEMIQ